MDRDAEAEQTCVAFGGRGRELEKMTCGNAE